MAIVVIGIQTSKGGWAQGYNSSAIREVGFASRTWALTRIRLGDKGPLYTRTTKPTPLQARAFELIGVKVA